MTARPPARLLWLSLSLGCAIDDISFVTTDDVSAISDAGERLAGACSRSEECDLGEYCAMPDCEARLGTCQRPTPCDSTFAPVCGCNGVTYHNDCLREVSGVGAATTGVCQSRAMRCGAPGDAPCPDGGYCARLFALPPRSGACMPELPGTCWVVPFECGTELDAQRWRPCVSGSLGPCSDLCSAIRSEVPHSGSFSCRP